MLRGAVLGAVQGVTEVLPVSSSGHLILVPWLLRWAPPRNRTALAAGLHAGSTLGLLWAWRREAAGLLTDRSQRPAAARVAVATLPAAAAGALGFAAVEERLGRPRQVALLLAATGLLAWLADRRPQERDGVNLGAAAAAGLAQVAALAPGVSRSAATRAALRAMRVDRPATTRFAALMSLPITAGAAGLSLLRTGRPSRELAGPLAAGAPVAAVTAAWLGTRSRARPDAGLGPAAAYRLLLATLALLVDRRRRLRMVDG